MGQQERCWMFHTANYHVFIILRWMLNHNSWQNQKDKDEQKNAHHEPRWKHSTKSDSLITSAPELKILPKIVRVIHSIFRFSFIFHALEFISSILIIIVMISFSMCIPWLNWPGTNKECKTCWPNNKRNSKNRQTWFQQMLMEHFVHHANWNYCEFRLFVICSS